MPRYDIICSSCSLSKEVQHSISERPVYTCDDCGLPMVKLIGNPNVHLKGDNWTGKLLKETEIRQRRSKVLDHKQRVEHKSDKVLPNVDGEVVSSWGEAKKLAKSKGYNTSSYDKFGKK